MLLTTLMRKLEVLLLQPLHFGSVIHTEDLCEGKMDGDAVAHSQIYYSRMRSVQYLMVKDFVDAVGESALVSIGCGRSGLSNIQSFTFVR